MPEIGIDFGTTHTTAAWYKGQALQAIPLDTANRDPRLLRSMVYIARENGEATLGVAAAQRYLQDNTGRLARFVPKVVGTIENTVSRISRHPLEPDGPITFVHDVIIEEDVGAPGRLLQSIKSALRDESYRGTTIFDRYYTVPELIALILRHVRLQAEATIGQPVEAALLGRPVRFSEEVEADRQGERFLEEAARLAGFRQVRFMLEPVAAAWFYTARVQRAETVLVFDFGGGTLDLTVMRTPGSLHNGTRPAPVVLATEGVLLGGDDFDSAIMRDYVAPHFGINKEIDAEGHPFPAHLAAKLYQWQTIPELSKTSALPLIRSAKRYGGAPAEFAALECLVTKNYGFPLFERIEAAKRLLSQEGQATIEMEAEAIDLRLTVSRAEFQRSIGSGLARVQRGLDRALEQAGVVPGGIDVVVTTGGSSLIPILNEILHRRFPKATLEHSDTFGSVAAGLALNAAATSQ